MSRTRPETNSRALGAAFGLLVFVDWSQNDRSKSTVVAYSLRAQPSPTVSTPLRWAEVEAGAEGAPLAFGPDDALARVVRHGDLFAPVLELCQRLPV